MPYLHWEIEEQQAKRECIINQDTSGAGGEDPDWNSDQKLLNAYLRDPHPLHIRRTLDQYYYHTLEDTKKRDLDQVVSRYQKAHLLEPRVITMVDQLWLWLLVGADGRADTVITCFPHRDTWKSSKDPGDHLQDPDPHGLTDVLRNIKLHLQDEPSSVKTAYDLAGVIASKCSRAYLDTGNTEKTLQFSEIYETAIGDVVSTFISLFI